MKGGGNPASVLAVSVLTDHPLLPQLTSEIKFFTSGIVIERCHTGTSLSLFLDLSFLFFCYCSFFLLSSHFKFSISF